MADRRRPAKHAGIRAGRELCGGNRRVQRGTEAVGQQYEGIIEAAATSGCDSLGIIWLEDISGRKNTSARTSAPSRSA